MLKIQISNGLARIVFNYPEKKNCLSLDIVQQFKQEIDSLNHNNLVSVIAVSSGLDNVFISGANIEEFSTFGYTKGIEMGKMGHSLMATIESSNKPIIAVVDGYALGGGFEFALACHIRIATNRALFGFPEVRLGIIPGYGGTQRILENLGKGLATELIITGKMITAQQCFEYGIINTIVDSEQVDDELNRLSSAIANNSGNAIKFALQSINNGYHLIRQEAMNLEIEYLAKCMEHSDFNEGTSAFLQKRKPKFNA